MDQDESIRDPSSRFQISLFLSARVENLLCQQHPPSVLSPRPSPHRPPTDLLYIFSVSFVSCFISRRSYFEPHGECQYWRARQVFLQFLRCIGLLLTYAFLHYCKSASFVGLVLTAEAQQEHVARISFISAIP
jgi:hypothetical protein